MEDVDFFRRARKVTKIKKFNKNLVVSTRRFDKVGIIKTQFKSFVCIIKYLVGVQIQIKFINTIIPIKMKKRKAIIIFVKYPEKGKVKTRLASTTSDNFALGIYKLLAGNIFNKLKY